MDKLHLIKVSEYNYQVFNIKSPNISHFPPTIKEIGNFLYDSEINEFYFYPLGTGGVWTSSYLKLITQNLEKLNNERTCE